MMHTGHKRNRIILVSAGAGVSQRIMQVISTLLLMPLLLRALGPAQFGIWGAAASLAWLACFVDIGTGAALVTLIAKAVALHDTAAARRYVTGTLGFGCGLAGLTGLGIEAAAIFSTPDARTAPYYIAAMGLGLNIPLNTANSVWMALQKGYLSSFWELVQTIVTFTGLILAITAHSDLWVYVAIVYGGLVLANVGSLTHLFLAHPELRPEGLTQSLGVFRGVASQGMLYFALNLTGGLSFMLDNILALALLGAEASAQMTIALRICTMALTSLTAVAQPLWPAFAEAAEKDDRHWIRRTFLRGSAVLVGITLAGAIVLLTYGDRLLRWWLQGGLSIDRSLLWAVAAWIFAQALIRVPCLLLNGLSIVRYQVVAASVTTLLALGLKFGLSAWIGVPGILWATTVPILVVFFPAVTWRVFHWDQRRPQDPQSQMLPFNVETLRPGAGL